jgi:hypothetical protein
MFISIYDLYETLPITPIGNQHRKSVVATRIRFLATFKSRFLDCCVFFITDARRSSLNMANCPTATRIKVQKFKPTKIDTEYIHPGGLSRVKGSAMHTPVLE